MASPVCKPNKVLASPLLIAISKYPVIPNKHSFSRSNRSLYCKLIFSTVSLLLKSIVNLLPFATLSNKSRVIFVIAFLNESTYMILPRI